jgi:hypothetical protein
MSSPLKLLCENTISAKKQVSEIIVRILFILLILDLESILFKFNKLEGTGDVFFYDLNGAEIKILCVLS